MNGSNTPYNTGNSSSITHSTYVGLHCVLTELPTGKSLEKGRIFRINKFWGIVFTKQNEPILRQCDANH